MTKSAWEISVYIKCNPFYLFPHHCQLMCSVYCIEGPYYRTRCSSSIAPTLYMLLRLSPTLCLSFPVHDTGHNCPDPTLTPYPLSHLPSSCPALPFAYLTLTAKSGHCHQGVSSSAGPEVCFYLLPLQLSVFFRLN